MSRSRSRRDINQSELATCFRSLGCSVVELHASGIPGFPDLVVGLIGQTHLVEIKNPETSYGRSGLNSNQSAFEAEWRGSRIFVVSSLEDVAAVVRKVRKGTANLALSD